LLQVIPQEFAGDKAKRTRALVQLMRHTGLAVMDAVTLERSELKKTGKLHRVTSACEKTGTHVSVLIPEDVATELIAAAALNENKRFIFSNTGTCKPQSAVTNWQHDLRQCFRSAGMPNGHPHQLCDTFAVRLLEKGVPLEEVSKLLGHKSIRVTEKHYAARVQTRQKRLDELVVGTWR
jgi:site-specific recombinase XerD